MANQPAQSRPWLFRLPSIARPAPESIPTPAAAPEPSPAQPRPILARPTFTQPTRPQEPTQPPQPPAQRSPPKPGGGNGVVASVPSSPVQRASAPTSSLPNSPVRNATVVGPVTTSSPVQSPPRPRSSLPSSPVLRPAQTLSVPTSPAPKPITSSLPTSPPNKPVSTTTTTASRVPSPVQNPTPAVPSPVQHPVVPSPHRSPKLNPTAPPPSPLLLPPARIKSDAEIEDKIPLVPEQKTVVVQKTTDKPKSWVTNGGNSDTVKSSIRHHGEPKEKILHKKVFSDSEDGGMRVITVAGENKGAFMEVIRSPNKKHAFEGNPHQLNKNDSDGNKWRSYRSSSEEEEGKPKMKDKGKATKLPMSAFMNSNVQGVNNSIVYNSSCTHHDPGLHLALSRKPAAAAFHVKDRTNGHNYY